MFMHYEVPENLFCNWLYYVRKSSASQKSGKIVTLFMDYDNSRIYCKKTILAPGALS